MVSTAQDKVASKFAGLPRMVPSEVGINGDAVVAMLDDAAARGLEIHSILLFRRDKLAIEGFRWPYNEDRLRIGHSVAKSFTACAIGFAVAEGLLNLSDKVVSFFPEHLPPLVDEKLAALTVEDLLTMRTGHADETSGSRWRGIKTSWIAEYFKIPLVYQPGTTYVYTSAASYMLSAILTKVSGQTLHGYLKPRLFEPLGIVGERWDMGPDGINPGGNGLTCTTMDLMKFGILNLQKGVWEGRQILPAGWVERATKPFDENNYAYHWVTGPEGEFYAMGLFGQLIAVMPKHDAVLLITSAINSPHAISGHLLPLVHDHLSEIFRGEAFYTEGADQRLLERLTELAQEPKLVSMSELRHVGVARYAMTENALGVNVIELDLQNDECALRLTDAGGVHTILMGIDHWVEGETDMPGESLHHGYNMVPSRVVAGARWIASNALEMTWIFAESAFRDTVVCYLSGDVLSFSRSVNINSGAMHWPDLRGYLVKD